MQGIATFVVAIFNLGATLRERNPLKYQSRTSSEALLKDSIVGEPSMALLCRWPIKI